MTKAFRCLFPFALLAATAPAARAACLGLAVGIDKYDFRYGMGSLSYCCADATAFRQALIDGGAGWTAASVTVLTNSGASKTAIRNALGNLAGQAVSGDTVVYYHSSHGGNDDTNLPSVHLCTYDADYTDEELASDLAGFASGVQLLVVADTCHSGGLFTDAAASVRSRSAAGPSHAPRRPAAWDLAGRVTGFMDSARASAQTAGAVAASIDPEEIGWLTAAAYYQYSYEGPDVGHGYFTYYLLQAFSWGDADGGGTLDFGEMFDFAACRVPYFDQTPQAAGKRTMTAATAAVRGVSPTPAGDGWDYADGRPELSPVPLSPGRSEQTHGPHTLRGLLDESDVFAFPVSALRPVRFWSTGGTELYADLYDAQFRLVRWEEESGQPGDFNLVAKPPADGTMYLKVYSGTANDSYTLHFCRMPGTDTFPTLYPPCATNPGPVATSLSRDFRVVVPEGTARLSFVLSGGTGDADLYLGQGFIPLHDWTEASTGSDNGERITVSDPEPGEWFVEVHASSAAAGMTLSATLDPGPASVEATLSGMRLEDGAATAEVLHPDLIPPPATFPVYAAEDLRSGVWEFLTNAPCAGGVVTLPVPDGTGFLAVGRPGGP